MKANNLLCNALAASGLAVFAAAALAQDYPTKPIRLIKEAGIKPN